MKISVLGYSGSGKSTLARYLGKKYHADVLHFDAIHWLPCWKENTPEEKLRLTEDFLNIHSSWVIDGTYSKYLLDRRLDESDEIVLMLFGPLTCLYRVIKRYFLYRGKTRPDMGEGCPEKLDFNFIKWVLFDGRSKSRRRIYSDILVKYPDKTVVIKNQRRLNAYMDKIEKSAPV